MRSPEPLFDLGSSRQLGVEERVKSRLVIASVVRHAMKIYIVAFTGLVVHTPYMDQGPTM